MTDQAVQPTWFMDTTQPGRPVRPAAAPVPGLIRPTLPASLIRALDRAFATPRQRLADRAAAAKRRRGLGRILLHTVLPAAAIVIWTGTVYDIDQDGPWYKQIAAAMLLEAGPEPARDASAPDMNVTTIAKTPAGFAQLVFRDATGPVGVPIALHMGVTSSHANEAVAIQISGLPESFYLTSGRRVASGSWMLRPGEGQGVRLVAPVVPPEPLRVSVSAIAPLTGELRAPVEELKVQIEPAAAPPEN